MTPQRRKILKALEEKWHLTDVKLIYEPLGMHLEMQGQEGGWFVEGTGKDGGWVAEPLGPNCEEALEMIDLCAYQYDYELEK
jgi:hypothetical protein